MPYDKIAEIMAVNLIAPVRLDQRLQPQQTIQVSSLSHQIGYPYAAVYAASKSALAVWGQCRGHLVVYPGPMDTPQAAAARLGGQASKAIMAPQDVAAQIFRASARGQRQLIPGGPIEPCVSRGACCPTPSRPPSPAINAADCAKGKG